MWKQEQIQYRRALQMFKSDILFWHAHTSQRTKDIQTYTQSHTHRAWVTGKVGERGLKKQGEMKSVFESKQRQSDQDQIGVDQTVVLK